MNIRNFLASALGRFPNLKRGLLALRDHRATQSPLKETPFGFRLAGSDSMCSGSFEIEETPWIRRLIESCDIFVNVGANIGYYCCFAAQAGKPVIAFEPHSVNCRLLLRNLEGNGFSGRAEVYPTAVGASNGVLNLYGSGTAASLVEGWAGITSNNHTLVPVITLDGVLSGRFDDRSIFLLIDVEGAELSVLEGAINTLARDKKPWWLIEITIHEHQPAGVSVNPNLGKTFKMIFSSGYEVWTLEKVPRRIEYEEIETIEKSGKDSIGLHNFLCVEPYSAAGCIAILQES